MKGITIAEYIINVTDDLELVGKYEQCYGLVNIAVEGNAGPYNIKINRSDYPDVLIKEFLDCPSDIDQFYEHKFGYLLTDAIVIIEDALGCEYIENIAWNCGCEAFRTTFEDNWIQPHPLTCSPEDESGRYRLKDRILTGGVGPYTFEWDDEDIVMGNSYITGFSHGINTVTVTDSRGCVAIGELNMVGQNAPKILFYNLYPTCVGDSEGTIEIQGTGEGESDIEFILSWSTEIEEYVEDLDGNWYFQANLASLSAGEYCVTVVDPSTTCDISKCFEVIEVEQEMPIAYTESLAIITKSCANSATGSIDITNAIDGGLKFNEVTYTSGYLIEFPSPYYQTSEAPAGIFDYKYYWHDETETNIGVKTNLGKGTYWVEVEDYCGNIHIIEYKIEEYPEIDVDVLPTPGCWDEGGTLEITDIVGGADTPTEYDIKWFNSDYEEISQEMKLEGLEEGLYNIEVTALETGCTETIEGIMMDNYPRFSILSSKLDAVFLSQRKQMDLLGKINNGLCFHPGIVEITPIWYDGSLLVDGNGNVEEYTVENASIVSYSWNGEQSEDPPNDTISYGQDEFNELFSANFSVDAIDNYGCTAFLSGTVKNKIIVKAKKNKPECGFNFIFPGHPECDKTINVGDIGSGEYPNVGKLCCFFDDCFTSYCKCSYPFDFDNFGWSEEEDLHEDYRDPVNYDMVKTLGPNCTWEIECPQESLDKEYCSQNYQEIYTEFAGNCNFTISDCTAIDDIDPCLDGDNYDNEMAFWMAEFEENQGIQLEFYSFFTFNSTDDNPHSFDGFFNLCLDLPSAGGDVSVKVYKPKPDKTIFDTNANLDNLTQVSSNPFSFTGNEGFINSLGGGFGTCDSISQDEYRLIEVIFPDNSNRMSKFFIVHQIEICQTTPICSDPDNDGDCGASCGFMSAANPFSDATTISFCEDDESFGQIEINRYLGSGWTNDLYLFNINLSPGINSFEINAADLDNMPGQYRVEKHPGCNNSSQEFLYLDLTPAFQPSTNGGVNSKVITTDVNNKAEKDSIRFITHIKNDRNETFIIFPNPTDGITNVVTNMEYPVNVSMYTVNGKLVFTKTYATNTENISFDGKDYKSGLYFINLKNNSTSLTRKLFIQL